MLEHLSLAEQVGTALLVIGALLGAIWGWLTKIKPRVGRIADVWAALVELLFGRPEEPPNPITGAPSVPAVPGIGPRLAATEVVLDHQRAELSVLTHAVAKLVDNEARLARLENRVTVLEDARVERVVAQAESAAMWSAVDREQHSNQSTDDTSPAADDDSDSTKELPS